MWLIEFMEGHLHGVMLPIESTLTLSGRNDIELPTIVPVPEYLQEHECWDIELRAGKLILSGLKPDKVITLVANRIYRLRGLIFFVYPKGKRDPKLNKYRFKQYKLLLLVTLIANCLLTGSFFIYDGIRQDKKVKDYLRQIEHAYVKNGKLYVSERGNINNLPQAWQSLISKTENRSDYLKVSQFNVELVSSYSGKNLRGKVVTESGRDQILIDTNEHDSEVMKVLGASGISFIKDDGFWVVSDQAKAEKLLKEHNISTESDKFKSQFSRTEKIIAPDDFPYSIFYSSISGHYIYNQNSRYWEGSKVPGFGVIESIAHDKVTFKNEHEISVFYYN